MNLLKKWDIFYWLAFFTLLVYLTAYDPWLYEDHAPFGLATFWDTFIMRFIGFILPAIFIWAVLKVIQKLIERRRSVKSI